MKFTGDFKELIDKGMLLNLNKTYYFLPNLNKGEMLIVDIKSRDIWCSNPIFLKTVLKGKVQE